MYIVLNIVTSL